MKAVLTLLTLLGRWREVLWRGGKARKVNIKRFERVPLEIAWLEDFLELDAKRSFSQAAEVRCVSQPAFSRRIQALEEWFGATLIDRATSPITLTPMGKNFRLFAMQVLKQTQDTKQYFRSQKTGASSVVRFAVAHTLVTSFFPSWYRSIKDLLLQAGANAHVNATNVMEGAKALQDREADFFVSFHYDQVTNFLPPDRFTSVLLARDEFALFSAMADGKPLFTFDSMETTTIPYLAYAPGTFFSQVVDMIQFQSKVALNLDKVFQTQMADAIKAMVLAGHGVGWLPLGSVTSEMSLGRLQAIGEPKMRVGLEVRIYRSTTSQSPAIDRLWDQMTSAAPQHQSISTPHEMTGIAARIFL
jgi:LysR family transcriptional regulator, hypochlorite-specific transcription factor HypT